MQLRPILASMWRQKAGAVLVSLQIAVTLAILCNALFIVEQRLSLGERPSGVSDEADVLVIENRWAGHPTDAAARVQADLTALRALPGVVDATVSQTYPLGGPIQGLGVTLHPDEPRRGVFAGAYYADDHALRTLGLKLVAGRNFQPEEIVDESILASGRSNRLDGIIVTQAVARGLAPHGNVVGRVAVLEPTSISAPIIGVVQQLQAVTMAALARAADNAVLVPYRAGSEPDYLVRAQPGHVATVMTSAQRALFRIDRARAVSGMETLADVRRGVYHIDSSVAVILSLACAALLAVTAWGIVGLTSYRVSQRRRQIGIRRALGATRPAIVRYFQTENLLITAAGIAAGVALAEAGNLWLVARFSMLRLPPGYLAAGTAAVLALGQLAALWPALRAAAVPPAVAARAG